LLIIEAVRLFANVAAALLVVVVVAVVVDWATFGCLYAAASVAVIEFFPIRF
jgi:F0F1-type ATP synthase membrane subunit a